MKVSFDFDSTLSNLYVQDFARELVNSGHEVWITTSRFSDEDAKERNWHWLGNRNKILFEVARKCGIHKSRIQFTSGSPKSEFLEGKGFVFHLDDDDVELFDIIESGDPCLPVDVNCNDWKKICKNILENSSEN
jgi:hypothetical protein